MIRAARLRPETQLLTDALAAALAGPGDPAGIEIPPGLDWERVGQMAWDHGVTPLVFRQLTATPSQGDRIPAAAIETLRTTATGIAAVNLRLTSELLSVSASLAKAEIPLIAYKGPTLAWRGYGDLALRHFSDLDLLVHPEDTDRAIVALRGAGYMLRDSESEIRAIRRWGHHVSLVRAMTESLVELHWRFHKPMFGPPTLEEGAWRNASEELMGGHQVRVLSVQDELMLIATHGSWHGWNQLSWICDIAALSAARSDWSAEALLDRARAARVVRPVLLGFELARIILRRPLPDALKEAVGRDRAVRGAARRILARIDSGRGPDAGTAALQFAVRDRIGDKLAFALRAAFVPNPSDVAALRLSDRLSPLYYLLRPARIAFKYRPRR